MQKIDRIFYIFCCFLITCAISLQASEYGPNTLFQMPYEADEYIGNFSGTFCAGKTNQSYDQAGQVVSFLHNYGKEDLLLNFIDPAADKDAFEKIGTIDFSGGVDFQCANLSYYKNIMHHMFLGVGTVIQNLNVYVTQANVDITATLDDRQERLLEHFESRIPQKLNTSGILSTYLESGYNRKFTELQSMEWLQLFLRGAILTPQWVQGGHLNLLQYPFTGNMTFGYQVIATITMKLTKHMNFGIFGTINSFQSRVMEVPHNEHILNNQLLIDKKTVAKFTPGTVYNGAVYWEFDNFKHNFTVTTGLSFMYGTARKVKPISANTYHVVPVSDINLNVNATLQTWNISALFFELDYNFLTQDNPQGPCLSLFFNTPLSGYHYPKINVLGGEFGLSFNYYL
jgi:hypothetical protein